MLRQVVNRRKSGLSVASLQNNSLFGPQCGVIGTSVTNKTHHILTRGIHRAKTFDERLEQNYYSNVIKANEEAERQEQQKEQEVTVLDRLFRFKPLKQSEQDELDDEFEGRPEHVDDDAYKMESGDPDPRLLLGKNLLSLGKVHYRHSDTLPVWFLEKQDEISNHRTSPQIRKCLKDWMVKNDRDLLDKYRKKQLKWGHLSSKNSLTNTETHTYGPDESIAYAHYFLSSRFAVLNRVLGEVKKLHSTFTPTRVLDFGCGPATGGASVRQVYDNTDFKYTGVDISQSMIDAGKIMTSGVVKNSTFYSSSSEIMKHALNTHERYDLIIASFSINELPNDPSRRIATQMLFELLDVGGMLVIVESGNPYGSHSVRTARQFMLDTFNDVDSGGRSSGRVSSTFYDRRDKTESAKEKTDEEQEEAEAQRQDKRMYMNRKQASKADKEARYNAKREETESYKIVEMMLPPPKTGGYSHDELGAYVVAPCTHDRPCPLANGVWCSFSQKVYSGVIRKANEEKFSYVVMQKRPKNSAYNYVGKEGSGGGKKSKGADTPTTIGTVEKQRGKFGRWVESSPLVGGSTDGDSPTATLDTTTNPTPLAVLQRFMETESSTEVTDLVDKLIDEVDWEEYDPPLYREEWGRLVRSPIKSKGHITVDVCTPEGQVLRSALSKGNLMHVPSLYTALRKTTWGGLFPVVSGNIERSSLSRNAKGTRYRGGMVVDKDVVVFDKYNTTSSGKDSGSSKDSKKGKTTSASTPDTYTTDATTYNIPGLPKGLVPTGEMIAASKSAKYRKLLESQAMRDEEEHDRQRAAELARRKVSRGSSGGDSSSTSVSASSGSSGSVSATNGSVSASGSSSVEESGGRRGRGFSAQLERLKAKRAAKEQSSGGSSAGAEDA